MQEAASVKTKSKQQLTQNLFLFSVSDKSWSHAYWPPSMLKWIILSAVRLFPRLLYPEYLT